MVFVYDTLHSVLAFPTIAVKGRRWHTEGFLVAKIEEAMVDQGYTRLVPDRSDRAIRQSPHLHLPAKTAIAETLTFSGIQQMHVAEEGDNRPLQALVLANGGGLHQGSGPLPSERGQAVTLVHLLENGTVWAGYMHADTAIVDSWQSPFRAGFARHPTHPDAPSFESTVATFPADTKVARAIPAYVHHAIEIALTAQTGGLHKVTDDYLRHFAKKYETNPEQRTVRFAQWDIEQVQSHLACGYQHVPHEFIPVHGMYPETKQPAQRPSDLNIDGHNFSGGRVILTTSEDGNAAINAYLLRYEGHRIEVGSLDGSIVEEHTPNTAQVFCLDNGVIVSYFRNNQSSPAIMSWHPADKPGKAQHQYELDPEKIRTALNKNITDKGLTINETAVDAMVRGIIAAKQEYLNYHTIG